MTISREDAKEQLRILRHAAAALEDHANHYDKTSKRDELEAIRNEAGRVTGAASELEDVNA